MRKKPSEMSLQELGIIMARDTEAVIQAARLLFEHDTEFHKAVIKMRASVAEIINAQAHAAEVMARTPEPEECNENDRDEIAAALKRLRAAMAAFKEHNAAFDERYSTENAQPGIDAIVNGLMTGKRSALRSFTKLLGLWEDSTDV